MMRTRSRLSTFFAIAALLLGTSIAPVSAVAGKGPSGSRSASLAAKERAPYARVFLALRGCTSCSHCRAAIRQMARSGSGGGTARVTTDAVEVRYARPGPIPLREVIRRLAENRLHDLDLVDVLFEVDGTIASGTDGQATFTLGGTQQSFPLAIGPSLAKPERGAAVRLTAVVEGWRGKSALRLVAREIRRES